tara:strand:+ start:531 stop:974 length:444 start_codon:yes stop_codon:yes gene_type:complete
MNKYIFRRILFIFVGIFSCVLFFYSFKFYKNYKVSQQLLYLPQQVVVQDLIKASVQPRLDRYNKKLYVQVSLESFQNPELDELLLSDAVSVEFSSGTILTPESSQMIVEDSMKKSGVLIFSLEEKELSFIIFTIYLYENFEFKWDMK